MTPAFLAGVLWLFIKSVKRQQDLSQEGGVLFFMEVYVISFLRYFPNARATPSTANVSPTAR